MIILKRVYFAPFFYAIKRHLKPLKARKYTKQQTPFFRRVTFGFKISKKVNLFNNLTLFNMMNKTSTVAWMAVVILVVVGAIAYKTFAKPKAA